MSQPASAPPIRAVFLDFMGTCLDWHSSVVRALPASLTEEARSDLALVWRQAFFDDIRSRPPGEAPEDIDVVHERLLKRLLEEGPRTDVAHAFSDASITEAVQAWHQMTAWQDVYAGLAAVREQLGVEVFVLANGTTRLQLDLVRSSGLAPVIDMLFSSQLLGVAKPTPEIYKRALDLVGLGRDGPGGAVMVAAHAYDLRAAKAVGLRTVYIRRWTDDLDETDDELLVRENDGYVLDDFAGLAEVLKKMQSASDGH
ncbi:haloacid dehalogenase, type II [Sporothrix schenckii ATCC 58251]|uniref:Haloacid dehalogenase, type II n=1 Tax=Sporothrix schenckii (strain ATCC 58251 / de Perez 2211183) TaxID=1391915 RepID=U7Q5V4_SPOS1|nr:haloacid dehalogenase, type II [Sporothrix schenckii ATCC 58251]